MSIFFLKKKSIRKSGLIPIYAPIVVYGLQADVSAKVATMANDWNSDAGRINARVKNARAVNDTLDEVYEDICQCIRQLLPELSMPKNHALGSVN